MREYFEAEMRLLHEAAQDFARAYPEQARMLNLSELRDRDPYVERLLEGVAFLTANIRQRIDESRTAISEQLLAQVCPQQLGPYPSTTIVEFQLERHRQTAFTLPKGVELLSEPVGSRAVACQFRTLREVTLLPLSIDSVGVEEHAAGFCTLRIGVRVDGRSPLNELPLDSLPLFLHADVPLALALYEGLCNGTRCLRVHFDTAGMATPVDVGGQECVRPMHLGVQDSVLPVADRGQPGFALLHDYFCAREKFFFVDLQGLDRVSWPPDCHRFELELQCRLRLPPEHTLGPENVRLHCVPAVNLFRRDSEPVELDHKRSEYPIVADARLRDEIQVYSVDRVSSREHRTGAVHDYRPLYALRLRADGERYFYTQRRDYGTGMAQTYLSIGGNGALEAETLSCEITACNGHLPRQYLHENQICVASAEVPSGLVFRNLTRPSPLWQPPHEREYLWRLNALLTLGVSSLADVAALQQALALFEWTGRKENRRRIEGIVNVRASQMNRVMKGILHRGLEITVTLQEEFFLSRADIYLFGQVLHGFFTLSANLNEFIQTRIVCQPSYQEFLWEPRAGHSCPL